jgi:hypothetical protein
MDILQGRKKLSIERTWYWDSEQSAREAAKKFAERNSGDREANGRYGVI